ncbi:MAG: type II toxin-antitoxin system RelE/ParE family toxin [Candidatus Rokuibacteriota bacterium]
MVTGDTAHVRKVCRVLTRRRIRPASCMRGVEWTPRPTSSGLFRGEEGAAVPPSSRQVVEAPRFSKPKRRLAGRSQREVDEVVKSLLENPLRGEPKTGALKGVRVVKFKISSQPFLLADQFDAKRNLLEALNVAPHENFYRDLQRYRESRV